MFSRPRISGWVQLMRPVNGLLTCASVWVGAFLAGPVKALEAVFVAGISLALIGGGANSLNDYFDEEVDRVNRPSRPLPSGRVKPSESRRIWYWASGLGLVLASTISLSHLAVALGVVLLLGLYNGWLKGIPILGNLVVSLCAGTAFLYGGLGVGGGGEAVFPAVFAFLFHLGREILKDLEDLPGDRFGQVQTLPIRYGPKIALWFTTVVFIILILATGLPYVWGLYGQGYLMVVALVDCVVLYGLWRIWLRPVRAEFTRISRLLKWNMVLGLIAICLK